MPKKKSKRYKFALRQRVKIVAHLGRTGVVTKRRYGGAFRDVPCYVVLQDDGEGSEWWPEMSLAKAPPPKKKRVNKQGRISKADEIKMIAWGKFSALGSEPSHGQVYEALQQVIGQQRHSQFGIQVRAALSGMWAALYWPTADEEKVLSGVHWDCVGAIPLVALFNYALSEGSRIGRERPK